MATYTEANQNVDVRKRVLLRESYIEAYPEKTPIVTAIPKTTNRKVTSPESSEVQWLFKTFSEGENISVYDGEDVTADEAVDNDDNKTVLKGRVQLGRRAVFTGRIAEATIEQHGGVTSKNADSKKDMLRLMREDQEKVLSGNAVSKAQTASPKVAYQTRSFMQWLSQGTHADLPIDAMAKCPAGQLVTVDSAADFTEASLRAMLQSCFEARDTEGKWHAFIHPDLQTVMDNWLSLGEITETTVPIRRYNQEASKGEIKLSVKSFSGSFGKVHFTPKNRMAKQFTYSVTTANGSATLTVASNRGFVAGMKIKGTGIASGATVLYVPKSSTTTVVMSANATATGTVTATVDQTHLAELWDFEFAELAFIDQVGYKDLENKGGGPRGYADMLYTLAVLNPQAMAGVLKTF